MIENQPERTIGGPRGFKLFREQELCKFSGAIEMLRIACQAEQKKEDESGSGDPVTNSRAFS